MSDTSINVNVLMPRALIARLDRVAGSNWRSRSGEIRRAVEDHVAAAEALASGQAGDSLADRVRRESVGAADHMPEPAQMIDRRGGES